MANRHRIVRARANEPPPKPRPMGYGIAWTPSDLEAFAVRCGMPGYLARLAAIEVEASGKPPPAASMVNVA